MRGSEFAELRALSEVVRAGSFSAAATELRMSRSALSQTIRRLEERLGVLLLHRSTRSLSPTEAGAVLLSGFDPAAAAMADALAAAQEAGGRIAGRLSIHAQRLGYDTILAPVVPTFLASHPDVNLDIRIDDAPIDIVAEGFDAGVRLGELLDHDMIAVAVGCAASKRGAPHMRRAFRHHQLPARCFSPSARPNYLRNSGYSLG